MLLVLMTLVQYQLIRIIQEQDLTEAILHIRQEVDSTEHLVLLKHMVGSTGGLIMRTNGI